MPNHASTTRESGSFALAQNSTEADKKLYRPGMLRDLVPITEGLSLEGDNLRVKWQYEPPTDENGVTDRRALIAMAVVATGGKLDFEGPNNVHHTAHPKNFYLSYGTVEDPLLGRRFRNALSNQIFVPCQIHQIWHVLFEKPAPQRPSVMKQFLIEDESLTKLSSRLHLFASERKSGEIDPAFEEMRIQRFHQTLEMVPDGKLGYMPDKNWLENLSIEDARREIGKRVGILTYDDWLQEFTRPSGQN